MGVRPLPDEVYRIDPKTGRVIMILPSPGPYPWGLAWAENSLWIADYQNDEIAQITVFDDKPYTRSKERSAAITISHDVINFGPGTVTALNVYLAVPKDRPTQEILAIDYAQDPDGMQTDQWGQEAARFSKTALKPQQRFISQMQVRAKIYDVMYHLFPEKVGPLKKIPLEIRNSFLADDDKYRLKDPVIQLAVKEAVGATDNPYWIARNIYDYLRDKLFYKRIGGWDIAPTVLQRGSGSCSGSHSSTSPCAVPPEYRPAMPARWWCGERMRVLILSTTAGRSVPAGIRLGTGGPERRRPGMAQGPGQFLRTP